ncbi:alpha-L-fucosidase [Sphingobacterium sp. SRCM116780]|uniref:alpha-L-fucosidase n=1 Tax=Sphingobacterium sp. SRCM116780 TaxID=2907623 RepID=UPI001F23036D|nr:alpha-L-fucosidase [Sphingobacterium sp. SRCM116780]UIR55279.1 alpha-L-fucosidase [Sphingobacterium sp. SRCM116780]
MKKLFLIPLTFMLFKQNNCLAQDIIPYGLTPNARQVEWYNQEIIAFFHFGLNTYEEFVNEGDGKASTSLFNPTDLNIDQWAKTLKAAGIPNGILTAKHADGFCLWPSAYTDYNVKNSPWKNGKGDVVKEFTEAFSRNGLKASVYLGPHDRHEHLHPEYSIAKYKQYYGNQLRELMGNYGPIWETWWDGAGADELTTPVYSSWSKIVHELQPNCVIFGTKNSYRFADVRWVGNESGFAGDPCWSTIDSASIRDEAANIKYLNQGELDGDAYIPAETDVSIRPSWFYHQEEDKMVKTTKELWDIYCQSVGRNSVLLLNLPPDRRGQLSPIDSTNVVQLRQGINETFGNNLLKGAQIKSKNGRGGQYVETTLLDNSTETFYTTKDKQTTDEITFTMSDKKEFDCLMIQEVIQLGHRTTGWEVDYSQDGKRWTTISETKGRQSIGHKWIVRFEPIEAKYIRLRITKGQATPALHSFGIYKQSLLFT